MLQQQQRKDEVLAFELKEPCTPLGQKSFGFWLWALQAQSWEPLGQMEKKLQQLFCLLSNTIDNILHGENEVRMWEEKAL